MKFPSPRLPQWRPGYTKPCVLAGLVLVAYLAAINRSQTLPWAIAALLGATLIIGVSWPHWLVRQLSVVRSGPQRAEEGDNITFRVEVENRGWLPRFMVELVDHLPFVGAANGPVTSADKTLGMVAYVPGGGLRRFEVSLVCEKRGFYRLGPVGLASSFPLGLAEARQHRNDGVQTLTIYPDVFPIMALPLRGMPSQVHRGGYLLPEGAGAAEFSGLREYRRGDNPRHVHWPTTARLNELMVKEFEPLASAGLYVVLDQAADANAGQGRHASFEYAVRIAASMVKFASASGIHTRLIGQGKHSTYLPAGSGEHHYQGVLEELAVIDADGATPYARVLERVALDCRHGETVVAFLSEPEGRLTDTLQALALLRSGGANLYVVVFDRESYLVPVHTGKREHFGTGVVAAALHDLGAHYLHIRKGDDLVRLFNT
jgi:uncharacterized protein (DUF58 family)